MGLDPGMAEVVVEVGLVLQGQQHQSIRAVILNTLHDLQHVIGVLT